MLRAESSGARPLRVVKPETAKVCVGTADTSSTCTKLAFVEMDLQTACSGWQRHFT